MRRAKRFILDAKSSKVVGVFHSLKLRITSYETLVPPPLLVAASRPFWCSSAVRWPRFDGAFRSYRGGSFVRWSSSRRVCRSDMCAGG